MNKTTALVRARRGAAWLDKKLGTGWRRKIRRRKLDMAEGMMERYDGSEGCGCVLAQLSPEGSWTSKARELGLDSLALAAKLGFVLSHQERRYEDEDWETLTEAWLTVLREGVTPAR